VALFGDRLDLAVAYAELLATEGTVRGLIGPREVPRLWDRHLVNCAAIQELIPSGSEVVDVGSGAGLPGLALAIARPDLSLILVEPLLRRASWLSDVVGRLDLDRVTVHRARAEELHGRLSVSIVTARAVAPLARLGSWCLPLLGPDGELLAIKGDYARVEMAASLPQLRRYGAVEASFVMAGAEMLSDPTSVVRVKVGSHGGGAPRSRPPRPPSARRRNNEGRQ
jgi:16S rRNA (guanine527-N7)-methyltransferase